MIFRDWANMVKDSWMNVWGRFVEFLPSLIGAIIILVIGWVIGMIVSMLIDRLFRMIGLQTLFEKAKIESSIKKAGIDKDTTALLAATAKWVVYLVAFIAAANTLNLPNVAVFFDQILSYVPSVIAAIAIMIIGLVLANFLGAVVKHSMQAGNLKSSEAMATMVRWSIITFAILAALAQLGIAEGLIQTLFVGLVAFLAIAGGLAFGLGGKDAAQDFITDLKKNLRK